tara:strand:- start:10728 stop:11252 length:525 start_codon:yes stop_codon:yes gene_type:complete
MTDSPSKALQKRSLAFEYIGLNKSIRGMANSHGITYSAMYQQLRTPEMQEVIADIGRQIEMRREDVVLFMQLNGPEYIQEMHNLAMGDGRDKMQALNFFLSRLHPVKEEAQQIEHKLTGEVAEQFAGAMSSLQGVLDKLPAKGSIHNDVHLLSGEDALPQPDSLDADYVDTTTE